MGKVDWSQIGRTWSDPIWRRATPKADHRSFCCQSCEFKTISNIDLPRIWIFYNNTFPFLIICRHWASTKKYPNGPSKVFTRRIWSLFCICWLHWFVISGKINGKCLKSCSRRLLLSELMIQIFIYFRIELPSVFRRMSMWQLLLPKRTELFWMPSEYPTYIAVIWMNK